MTGLPGKPYELQVTPNPGPGTESPYVTCIAPSHQPWGLGAPTHLLCSALSTQ